MFQVALFSGHTVYPIDFSTRTVLYTHLRVAVADVGGRVDAVEVLVPPVVVDVLLAGAGDVHAGAGGIGAHRRAAADPVSKRGEGRALCDHSISHYCSGEIRTQELRDCN